MSRMKSCCSRMSMAVRGSVCTPGGMYVLWVFDVCCFSNVAFVVKCSDRFEDSG